MNQGVEKTNNPELVVDWNGHAVQAWVLGGPTIKVATGSTFKAVSTLLRVCNSSDAVARVKLKDAAWDVLMKDMEDVGMPILPNESMILGCLRQGQVFEVVEGSIDVTYFYDRRVSLSTDIPEYGKFVVSEFEGFPVGSEVYAQESANMIRVTGMVPYVFADVVLGRVAGNRVGVKITPKVDAKKYPDAIVTFMNHDDPNPRKMFLLKDVLNEHSDYPDTILYWPLIKEPGSAIHVKIDWAKGLSELFTLYIDSKVTLQNG